MVDSATPAPAPRAAYLHVPFCVRRCGYCNFTVVAGRGDLVGAYLDALARELSWLESPRQVDTLFIGGGTPTFLAPGELARLFDLAQQWFPLAAGGEFSIEANPADVDPARARLLAERGVTRVSLGAQSFHADKLRILERDHSPEEIRGAFELLRPRVGSISFDLIFAAPGETLETWRADLAAALELAPDHLSTYGLTYERGARFYSLRRQGMLRSADEELELAMYAAAIDELTAAGFEHYEVSNFARPGHRCRHHEVYWSAGEYYAAGPGASRYVAGRRETNHRSTTTWLARVIAGRSPVEYTERLSPQDRAREALVLGLRRAEGINREVFLRQTGYSVEGLLGDTLTHLAGIGMLHDDGRAVRLSRRGLFVGDSICSRILSG